MNVKEQDNKNVIQEINELTLTRSNAFIQSKHNCSLIENKLIAVGLSTVKVDERGNPFSDIPVSLLKQFEGIEQTNVYKKVKEVAETITKHTVILEENLNGKLRFEVFTLVNNASYMEGQATFRLTFNPSIIPMISDIKGPYTSTRVRTLMSFKNNYAYRLYEILSTKEYLLYPKKNKTPVNSVIIKFDNINELRMMLTLIDIDDEKLKPLFKKPYEQLSDKEKEKMDKLLETSLYKDWRDLRKSVIEVARMHMNNNPLCPIAFEYEPIRAGRGGKVVGIKFEIRKNESYIFENEYLLEKLSDEKNMIQQKIKQVREFIDAYDTISDYTITSFLECANYDVERIKRAFELAQKQEFIENFTGWMLAAIKEGWAESNVILLQERSIEESESLQQLHQQYMSEIVDYKEEGQISFDFENNSFIVEQEETKSSEERMVELIKKSSHGQINKEEEEELHSLLLEFTKESIIKRS